MKSHGPGRDSLVQAFGRTLSVYVSPRPTRITGELGAAQLSLGESTTFSGLAEALVDGEWVPLTGRLIQIEFEPVPGGGAIFEHQLSTDGQGRFQVTVRPPSTGRYVAVFNRGKPNEFFEPSRLSKDVAVLQPVRFSTGYFIVQPTPDTRDDPARYQLTGIIYTITNPAMIEIQYRRRSSDAWQTLATTRDSHGSNDGGKVFTGWFTLPGSGQIRAFAPATVYTLPAASQIVNINLPGRLVTPRLEGDGTTSTLPPQRRY